MTHPHEEIRAMKEAKAHYDMLGFIADAQYGIPKKCPCGGRIINEVSPHLKYPNDKDTLPGRKFFTCNRFEDDGMHFRQPWVFGVQEELEKMTSRVDEMASEIKQEITQKLNDLVNLQIARVEREMAQKVEEKVKIESVRVQKEMNKKLKLATMAMLAVGAIIGICSAL